MKRAEATRFLAGLADNIVDTLMERDKIVMRIADFLGVVGTRRQHERSQKSHS
jgi:hypothetical protein